MKFIISSTNFLKTIQPLIGIVVNNPALPIIENLLLESNNNTLSVKVTDLETTIITKTSTLPDMPAKPIRVSEKSSFR